MSNSHMFRHWDIILREISRTKQYKSNTLYWVLYNATGPSFGMLYRPT